MIVLDTHAFIWYALDHPNLPASTKAELYKNPDQVLVPSICFWEMALLSERGRIALTGRDQLKEIRYLLHESKFIEAPLTVEIALLSRSLSFAHEDPADRFIAATAHFHGAKLATSDEKLRHLPWIQLAY